MGNFLLNSNVVPANYVIRGLRLNTTPSKVEARRPNHVVAQMAGLMVRANVAEWEVVPAGHKLATLEAMKMETTVYAQREARVAEVLASAGTQVETGDLLIRFGAAAE